MAVGTNTLFVLELVVFNGVALGWAGWELWSLRRDGRKAEDAKPPADGSPEPPRHPEG